MGVVKAERKGGSGSLGAALDRGMQVPRGALQGLGTSWDPAPHLNYFWCQPGDAGSPDGEDRPLEKD